MVGFLASTSLISVSCSELTNKMLERDRSGLSKNFLYSISYQVDIINDRTPFYILYNKRDYLIHTIVRKFLNILYNHEVNRGKI